jgi:hypothetical protein
MKPGPRPKRSKGKWYVSFEHKRRLSGKPRHHPRVTEPFRNEQEAKAFAKTKLAEGRNVSAGTLNPHQPKRTIASAQILDWLNEPNDLIARRRMVDEKVKGNLYGTHGSQGGSPIGARTRARKTNAQVHDPHCTATRTS